MTEGWRQFRNVEKKNYYGCSKIIHRQFFCLGILQCANVTPCTSCWQVRDVVPIWVRILSEGNSILSQQNWGMTAWDEQHFSWKGREKQSWISGYQSWGLNTCLPHTVDAEEQIRGGFITLGEHRGDLFTFSDRQHVITADDSSTFWDTGYANGLWSFH